MKEPSEADPMDYAEMTRRDLVAAGSRPFVLEPASGPRRLCVLQSDLAKHGRVVGELITHNKTQAARIAELEEAMRDMLKLAEGMEDLISSACPSASAWDDDGALGDQYYDIGLRVESVLNPKVAK